METEAVTGWGVDYAWGLPIIVLTVVIHAYGLGFINKVVESMVKIAGRLLKKAFPSTLVIGGTVLLLTMLHGFECAIWAAAYRLLSGLQNNHSAMLYSLNAMTSYGHESFNLPLRLQMMGAMESLDGWLLFGLTTAFLFTVVQRAWSQS